MTISHQRNVIAKWSIPLLVLSITGIFIVRGFAIPTGSVPAVYRSFDAPTASYAGFGLDHVLDLAQNFFTRTRWNRTFKLICGYPIGN